MSEALPKPDLKGQFVSGLHLAATGRVFRAWDTGIFFTWWLVVIVMDALTTHALLRGQLGEEGNPIPAFLFSHFGPVPTMLVGSIICLCLAAFTVGEHRREDTYWLLLPPTLILIVKTWASLSNALILW